MAPSTSTNPLLSPAELSYLHTSLSLTPPLRPDARTTTQFRSLIAETSILPSTNGSARICFADGTEAIVGVKAEVEKSPKRGFYDDEEHIRTGGEDAEQDADQRAKGKGENKWVEMTIEIPGFRDDDALPIFVAAMLNEALLSTGDLAEKLYINDRWHWKLCIDILLLSPPLSPPIPLLSLTTHLALLSTRLPALISDLNDDPLFNDDWDASVPLYPRSEPPGNPSKRLAYSRKSTFSSRPPITLLVAAVGGNILFDPSPKELCVADTLLAVSVCANPSPILTNRLNLLSIRTMDPPSRQTHPGTPDAHNPVTGGGVGEDGGLRGGGTSVGGEQGVWRPPLGGMKRDLISKIIDMVTREGGVGEEVLKGLEGVDVD